jgi:glutathione S-transferase
MRFTGPVFGALVRTPPERRSERALSHSLAILEAQLVKAEARLDGRPFLVGDSLTLADIQFGHILYRYFDLPIPRQERPSLAAYYTRLTQRPAFAEHVMISYESLRA